MLIDSTCGLRMNRLAGSTGNSLGCGHIPDAGVLAWTMNRRLVLTTQPWRKPG
jgi:hypothetical protein